MFIFGKQNKFNMRLRDLTVKKDIPISDINLTGKNLFIYQHGLFNCKILKFKSAIEVLTSLKAYDPSSSLSIEQKQFILKNSNREVLCYLCRSWEDRPDIFVYGDNNIAFQIECFI